MKNKLIALFAFLVIGPSVAFAATSSTLGPNLIQNPSMETAGAAGMPADWNEGNWGTNTTVFKYPVTGINGGVGANVAISSYASGDAKWYFNNVAVTPGTNYAFSDSYSSTIPSLLVAQFTSKTNTLSYAQLGGTLPATNGAWTSASTTFTPPANTAGVTIFHLIQSVGSLTTDNFFLGAITTSTATSTPPMPTITINPTTLPNGTVGKAYSQILTASTTAIGPFIWSISSGSLPAGLNLGTSTGVTDMISGTPTTPATSTFAVKATNGSSSSTGSYIINMASAIATSTPTSTLNLIANPTFASSSPTNQNIPQDWQTSSWGDASGAVFSYPVMGEDDNFAAQVTIASYQDAGEGNGAAEWYFNNVPVTPGALYNFSDWYKSNTDSYLIAQWTLTDGSLAYDNLQTFSTTNSAWTKTPNEVFSAPTNAVSLTVLHLMQSAGTLAVDNYSLAPYIPTTQNAFPEAMASLTFDDGWASQYNNALPIMNAAHVDGTFYIITDDIVNPADEDNLFSDSGISTSTITTTSTASWSNLYTDPTNQAYAFGESYTQTAPSTISASYTIAGKASSTVIGTVPAGTGSVSFAFTLPTKAGGATVSPIKISQTLSGTGTLKVSNPSLTEYQAYMTTTQVDALQTAGNEIDSHTETHPDLTALSTTNATTEIDGSRTALQTMGASPVNGFAYPFGNYNAGVEQLVKNDGYIYARTVDVGYNDESYNPFIIKTYSVVASTTLAQVESWVNTAAANNWWLVLTFHDIDPANILASNGETYGTTPQELQQIIAYLQGKNIPIKTMDQAIAAQ